MNRMGKIINQKKKWTSWMKIGFFLLLSLSITSCQPDLLLPVSTPVSQTEYQVSTSNYATKDPSALRPLLFTPEDLDEGWVQETYKETTQNLLPPRENNPFIDRMRVSMAAEVIPPPNRLGFTPGSKYLAIQSVDVYTDRGAAANVFAQEKDVWLKFYGQLPDGIKFHSLVENYVIGCSLWYDSRIGEYLNCNFQVQYDRYIVHANMTVDGKLITLQDWEDMVNVVQDRLINHVEQERMTSGETIDSPVAYPVATSAPPASYPYP